jgi:hypothetical protein
MQLKATELSVGHTIKRIGKPSCLATIAALVLAAANGTASTISAVSGPLSGTGTVAGSVSTPFPGLGGNTISVTEAISSFSNTGFDLLVGLDATTYARTEYTVTKIITNNTNFTWNTFSVAVGCDPLGTVPCFGTGANNPLRMDYVGLTGMTPTLTGTTPGFLVMNGESYFTFTGLSFAPHAPALTLTFNIDAGLGWSGGALMYQDATAPEPATCATVGAVFILLGLSRHRRKPAAL